MAKLNAQEFREKHARNLKASQPDIRRGIERVTVAPGKAAAAKQEKMKANINASIDSGKWAKNVSKVSLSDWQTKAINKGIPRIATGIDAAAAKVEAFASRLLPAVDAAVNKIKTMPDLTLDDNIARMGAYAREMARFTNA